jgi:hypothetical protein
MAIALWMEGAIAQKSSNLQLWSSQFSFPMSVSYRAWQITNSIKLETVGSSKGYGSSASTVGTLTRFYMNVSISTIYGPICSRKSAEYSVLSDTLIVGNSTIDVTDQKTATRINLQTN